MDGYFKIGDSVRLQNRSAPWADYQALVVSGFGMVTVGHLGCRPLSAGIYRDPGTVWLTAYGAQLPAPFPAQALELACVTAPNNRQTRVAEPDYEPLRSLPSTIFAEGDLVTYHDRPYVVAGINYIDVPSHGEPDDSTRAIYLLASLGSDWAQVWPVSDAQLRRLSLVSPQHIHLMKRGNVWRELHGEPLSFDGDGDDQRVIYELRRGRFRIAPGGSLTVQEALALVRDGKLHGYCLRPTNGPEYICVGVTLNNPALGRQYSGLLLDGYGPPFVIR